ncbi:MAG: hypothetical protein KDK36_11655 [Leptospiraceae bacterium]|nr:hypothetical protein [Leptospiraceae bacterium]
MMKTHLSSLKTFLLDLPSRITAGIIKVSPRFLKRLDKYLLLHYPNLWITRAHFILPITLILFIIAPIWGYYSGGLLNNHSIHYTYVYSIYAIYFVFYIFWMMRDISPYRTGKFWGNLFSLTAVYLCLSLPYLVCTGFFYGYHLKISETYNQKEYIENMAILAPVTPLKKEIKYLFQFPNVNSSRSYALDGNSFVEEILNLEDRDEDEKKDRIKRFSIKLDGNGNIIEREIINEEKKREDAFHKWTRELDKEGNTILARNYYHSKEGGPILIFEYQYSEKEELKEIRYKNEKGEPIGLLKDDYGYFSSNGIVAKINFGETDGFNGEKRKPEFFNKEGKKIKESITIEAYKWDATLFSKKSIKRFQDLLLEIKQNQNLYNRNFFFLVEEKKVGASLFFHYNLAIYFLFLFSPLLSFIYYIIVEFIPRGKPAYWVLLALFLVILGAIINSLYFPDLEKPEEFTKNLESRLQFMKYIGVLSIAIFLPIIILSYRVSKRRRIYLFLNLIFLIILPLTTHLIIGHFGHWDHKTPILLVWIFTTALILIIGTYWITRMEKIYELPG